MLAKAFCLIAAALANVVSCRPPASQNTVSPKDDKIQKETHRKVDLKTVSKITVLKTSTYLLLMILADHPRGPCGPAIESPQAMACSCYPAVYRISVASPMVV